MRLTGRHKVGAILTGALLLDAVTAYKFVICGLNVDCWLERKSLGVGRVWEYLYLTSFLAFIALFNAGAIFFVVNRDSVDGD